MLCTHCGLHLILQTPVLPNPLQIISGLLILKLSLAGREAHCS